MPAFSPEESAKQTIEEIRSQWSDYENGKRQLDGILEQNYGPLLLFLDRIIQEVERNPDWKFTCTEITYDISNQVKKWKFQLNAPHRPMTWTSMEASCDYLKFEDKRYESFEGINAVNDVTRLVKSFFGPPEGQAQTEQASKRPWPHKPPPGVV